MRARSESVSIPGPVGVLEALLETRATADSAQPPAIGVLCHPHPLYGGTLTNKVVHTAARALLELGIPALRFNFRGVGTSGGVHDDGIGETQDLLAAAKWLRGRWADTPLYLGGFSFGAYVALRGAEQLQPARLITIAPPIGRWDLAGVTMPQCPWQIVQGEADEVVDAATVFEWAAQRDPAPTLTRIAGAGHFFHGQLHELKGAILGFLRPAGPQSPAAAE